jgi:hypothetical protein
LKGDAPAKIAKASAASPGELTRQLPHLPAGCQRVVIGTKAVILNPAQEILGVTVIR